MSYYSSSFKLLGVVGSRVPTATTTLGLNHLKFTQPLFLFNGNSSIKQLSSPFATKVTDTPIKTSKEIREEKKRLKEEEKKEKFEAKVEKLLEKRLAPKRSPSPFNLYVKDHASNAGGLREAVKQWKLLDADKLADYQKRAAEIAQTVEESANDVPQAPKRPINAFQRYVESLRRLYPQMKYMEVVSQAAGKWKLLSDHEKKSFYDSHKQDEAEYKHRLQEYQTNIARIKDEIRSNLESGIKH